MGDLHSSRGSLSLLFVFLDGVGIGENNPGLNPLAGATPRLDALLGPGWKFSSDAVPAGTPAAPPRPDLFAGRVDPVMGVPGLPQSATGQCSLITGANCQKEIGGHWGPRPNSALRAILRRGSLFTSAADSIAFAAAFPKSFFNAIVSGRRIPSTLQQAFLDAGGRLPGEKEFREGSAISSDITGRRWHSHLGYTDTPVCDPETAAARLFSLAAGRRITLYEYWYSDHLGHRGSFEEARVAVAELDRFLAELLHRALSGGSLLVVVSSDHGNIEDFSTRTHTANPVPFIAAGPGAGSAAEVSTIAEAGAWMRSRL